MAKTIGKQFNFAAKTVLLEIEDDFGAVSKHTVFLGQDKCSHCGSLMAGPEGKSIEEIEQSLLDQHEELDSQALSHFERAGADVSAIKAKRKDKDAGQTGKA